MVLVLNFGIWGGLVAHSKRRNVVGYAMFAACLPLVGILVAYVMPALPERVRGAG
jgi:hypothetical protein